MHTWCTKRIFLCQLWGHTQRFDFYETKKKLEKNESNIAKKKLRNALLILYKWLNFDDHRWFM